MVQIQFKIFTIKRIAENDYGMFGVLLEDNIPFAVTLERNYIDNQSNISSIPTGIYVCERVQSPHFGNTFEIKDVPGRSHILFHKGNLKDHSQGCILVGEQYESLNGKAAILRSGAGFSELMNRVYDFDCFILIIEKCYD